MTTTILVVYHTKTGSTGKLAEQVAKGVTESGAEVLLRSIDQVTKEDMLTCHGLIVGSPVYFGTMSAPVKAFFDNFVGLRKKMTNKAGAAFSTSAYHSGGKETTLMAILQCMLIYGLIIMGDPLESSGHYGVACSGKPNDEALRNAYKLGCRIAKTAGLLIPLQETT